MAANILMEKGVRQAREDDFVIQIELRMSVDMRFFGTAELFSRAQQLRRIVSLLTGVNSEEIKVLPLNTSNVDSVPEQALVLLLSIETQNSAYQKRHVQNLCLQLSDPTAPIRRRLENTLGYLAQSWTEVKVNQYISVLRATLYLQRDTVPAVAHRRLLGLKSNAEVGEENSLETRAASLFVRSYNNTNNYDNLIAFSMNSVQANLHMRMCTISVGFSARAYCFENETANLRALDLLLEDGFRNSSNNSIVRCRAMALAPSQPTFCEEQKASRRFMSRDSDTLLLLDVEIILFSESTNTVHMTASRQLTAAGITRILLHDTKQAQIFHISFDSAVFDPDGSVHPVSEASDKKPINNTESSTFVTIMVIVIVFGGVIAIVYFGWCHSYDSTKKDYIPNTHHVVVYQTMPSYRDTNEYPV